MKKFSARLAAIALAMGLGACADPGKPDVATGNGAGEKTLRIFTWGDYLSPIVVEEFTARTGIAVEVVTFKNGDEMVAKMHSEPENYDVVTVDDLTIKQLRDLSVLRPLDRDKLKNFGNVDGRYLNLESDPGNRFSIPYLAGTTVVAYRKDKVENPEESWGILFDPRWKGRVAMLDENEDVLAVARLVEDHPASSRVPEHTLAAGERILTQIREVGVKFGSFEDILAALDRGEIWVAMNYSGDILRAARKNPEIGFFMPKEGAIKWLDSLVISRDTKMLDEAHLFLDFMLEGDNAAESANHLCLASPNVQAGPGIDPEIRADRRIYLSNEDLAKAKYLSSYKDLRAVKLEGQVLREIWAARREAEGTELVTPPALPGGGGSAEGEE